MSDTPRLDRPVPSSFDLSGAIELYSIPRHAPWLRLRSHLERVRPRAVLGACPIKLQLDPRIYDIVSELHIPYLTCAPENRELASELVRAMNVDVIVTTGAAAPELAATLTAHGLRVRAWHIITPRGAEAPELPGDVIHDEHEYPGKSYGD